MGCVHPGNRDVWSITIKDNHIILIVRLIHVYIGTNCEASICGKEEFLQIHIWLRAKMMSRFVLALNAITVRRLTMGHTQLSRCVHIKKYLG